MSPNDYHIILQKLLPLVIRRILTEDVARPLIELSRFFSALCSNELVPSDFDKLSSSIKETICETNRISANGSPTLSTSVVVPGGLPRANPVSAMPKSIQKDKTE
jgi:hypothetical protein